MRWAAALEQPIKQWLVGWRRLRLEVSITKRSISPDLVLTLGIADDSPLDAVRAARAIVTVHSDADAAVHQRADLGIVAAPMDLAAALVAELDSEEHR